MKLFIIFAVTILCVTGDQLEKWSTFKLKHKKSYKNVAEETQRFNIFKENLRTIEAHNVKYHNGEVGYFMGVNRFADMSPEEFRGMLNVNSKNKPQLEAKVRKFDENVKLPEAVDWRDSGAVLPVKNQLTTCPSWWAFASTGALEAQNVILNNISIALSEQQILDCSGDYGNYGCEGGYGVRGAFHYVQDHGIASEEDYPYIAEDGNCKEGQVTPVISALFDYESVEMLNEAALLHAVAAIGPITTEINGDLIQFYQGGIFDDYGCLNGADDLNYGGLLVGYNLAEGANYWILKNSWGTEWGEEGYIRIQQGLNICGITRSTNYPVLELN